MSVFRHYLLFVLLFSPSFLFLQAQKVDSTHQLLWEISAPGLAEKSYLFGTFHTRDERVFRFPDSLFWALDQCDAYAMEIDPDSMMRYAYRIQLALNGDAYPVNYLYGYPSALRPNQKKKFEVLPILGMPIIQSWMYEPSGYMNDNSSNKYPTFLDAFLYRVSRIRGKEFRPVEALEEQMDIDTDPTEGNFNLRNLLGLVGGQGSMVTNYRNGDLDAIHEMMLGFYEGNQEGYDALITNRNIVMADRAAKMVRAKSYFIAVGTAHLPGKEGVINLLRERGFTLRPVLATFSDVEYKFKSPLVQLEWHKVQSAQQLLNMEMPIEPVSWPLPQWGSNIFLSPDLSTGTTYFATDFDVRAMVPNGKFTSSKVLKSFMESWQREQQVIFVSESPWELNGQEGKEYVLKTEEGNYIRVGILIGDKYGVLAGVIFPEGLTNHLDADRFFKNLTFHLPQKGNDWQKFTSELDAFSINLPSNTVMHKVPVTYDDQDREIARVYSAYSKVTGAHFVVSVTDPPAGTYWSNDSLYLETELLEMLDNASLEIVRKEEGEFEGFRSLSVELKNSWKDLRYQSRYILRGMRVYGVHVSTLDGQPGPEEAYQVLNSFSFEPYPTVPLKRFTNPARTFSVMLPGSPALEADTMAHYYFNAYTPTLITRQRYTMKDPATGGTILIMEDEFSPYLYAKNDTALFFKIVEDIRTFKDSVKLLRITHDENLSAAEFELSQDKSNNTKQVKIIWNGDRMISLLAMSTTPRQKEILRQYYDSFSVRPVADLNWVYEDKKERFFEDIFSGDKEKVEQSEAWLAENDLTEKDMPMILKFLEAPIPADSGVYDELKIWFLQSFKSIDSVGFFASAKSIYQADTSNFIRLRLLDYLLTSSQPQGMQVWADLVVKETPRVDDYFTAWGLVRHLTDSIEEVGTIFPQLMPLLSHETLGPLILEVAGLAADKEVINPYEHPAMQIQLIKVIREIYENREEEEPNIPYQFTGDYLRLLKYFEYSELEGDLINKLLEDEHIQFAPELLSVLVMRDDPRYHEYLDKILRENKSLLSLYKELELIGRLQLMPKSYQTQEKMAISQFIEEMEVVSEEPVRDVEVVTIIREEIGDKTYLFYMLKFAFDSEPENEYMGVSGGFHEDLSNFEPEGFYVGTTYTLFEDLSVKEHLEEFLMEY